MAEITVQAEERQEVGKGPNRRLRTQGKILYRPDEIIRPDRVQRGRGG